MFTLFTRKSNFEHTSLKTYPELRYVFDNIKHNISVVKRFATVLNYRPPKTSVLEKLIINYCPSLELDDFYFYQLVSEYSKDVWCRALGMNYYGSLGKTFRDDLHLNGDEFYVVKDSNLLLTTLHTKEEKLNWLLNFEPVRVIYTTSSIVDYEFRQKFLDLNNSFIVMEVDPVMLFMGYKYWTSILGEEDSKAPFLYISKFVMPGMIRSRTQWQIMNSIFNNAPYASSGHNLKIEDTIQSHNFKFKLLDIDRPMQKSITSYLKFIYNRKIKAEVLLNTMPFIPFNENQTPLDFLLLQCNTSKQQTRWVKWLTRAPVILSLLDLFGESGKGYNRDFFTGFKYEMKEYEHNNVPLPGGYSLETKAVMDTDFQDLVMRIYGKYFNPGS